VHIYIYIYIHISTYIPSQKSEKDSEFDSIMCDVTDSKDSEFDSLMCDVIDSKDSEFDSLMCDVTDSHIYIHSHERYASFIYTSARININLHTQIFIISQSVEARYHAY